MAKSMSASVITACQSCRSRKVKCDKVHPRCGPCVKHSFECVFVHERRKRGPRKGELEWLKAQVSTFVRILSLPFPGSFLRMYGSCVLTLSEATLKQKLAVQQAGDQLTSPTVYMAAPSEVAASQAAMSEHATRRNSQTDQEPNHADHCSNVVSDVYVGTGTDSGEGWDARVDPEFMAWLDLTLPSTDLCLPVEPSGRHSYIRDTGQLGVNLNKLVKADL